jgi:hypothetical protein
MFLLFGTPLTDETYDLNTQLTQLATINSLIRMGLDLVVEEPNDCVTDLTGVGGWRAKCWCTERSVFSHGSRLLGTMPKASGWGVIVW